MSSSIQGATYSSSRITSSSSSAGASAPRRMEVKNNDDFLEDTFPELIGKLNIITAPFANAAQTYNFDAELENVLDATGFSNIRNLKQFLQQKGIERPRVLSLIDLQKDFLNGGSLMVPGAEEKVFAAIERLLKENARLIAEGNRGFFDVIIMTKDFHPEGHRSFTSKFFELREERFDTRRGFRLVLNEQGTAVGATVRRFWSLLPHIAAQFDFPEDADRNSFCLIPKTPASYAGLKRALQEGAIMPFSVGLHPVPVTAHMLRKVSVESKEELFTKLKQIGLLNQRGDIDPAYKLNQLELKDAFDGAVAFPPDDVTFNAEFVKEFAQKLERSEDVAKQVLKALLENFWPDHCVQGSSGHQFHEELVRLLATYAPEAPLIPLPKGNTLESGEAYSAGRNTAGNLATPYLPLLKYLNAEKNFVCGTATGFCPSGAARDSAEAGIDTTYWTGASKGITEPEENATHQELTNCGINVVSDFPGLPPARVGTLPSMASFASLTPAQVAALSSSSGARAVAISAEYFQNAAEINAGAGMLKFGANILLGPNTPGFVGKHPMPFSFASCGRGECAQIAVEKETRFKVVGGQTEIKDEYDSFNYDKDHSLAREFDLSFQAYLSPKAQINLPEEAAKKLNIDPAARSYCFVYPCETMGSQAFFQKAAQDPEYFNKVSTRLNAKLGENLASLAIIGGYAYFDATGTLIQTKPIVPRATADTLPIEPAMLSVQGIPPLLRREFEASVEQLKANLGRDGLSNPITAPELLGYGATHFAYIPNGYYPESLQEAILAGNLSFEMSELKEKCDLLWESSAKYGLFIYKFADSKHDCFLAISTPKQPARDTSDKKAVTIQKANNVREKVMAILENSCAMCLEAQPNRVWHVQPSQLPGAAPSPAYFKTYCCSECDTQLTAENRKAIADRCTVIGNYPFELDASALKQLDFYDVLHVKRIERFGQAKVNEMALSKRNPITVADKGDLNIPGDATEFVFAYPSLKLAASTDDAELKLFYEYGGFVYYKGDQVVGVNNLHTKADQGTKPIGFAPMKQLENLSAEDRQGFAALIAERKIPQVTIKTLRAKGVNEFMWIHPGDRRFASQYGQFIYFNSDGSQIFVKEVDPTKRQGDGVF